MTIHAVPFGARLAAMEAGAERPIGWEPRWLQALRGAQRALTAACWANLVAVTVGWAGVYLLGDRWWLATVMLFSPRWLWAVPGLVLLALAVLFHRWALLPLVAALVVVLFGPMGLSLPWRPLGGSGRAPLTVISLNCQGQAARPAQLRALITDVLADAVALQECDYPDDLLRHEVFPDGWYLQRKGRLVIASPYPVTATRIHRQEYPVIRWPRVDALYCILDRPSGAIGFASLHLRTPRDGLSRVLNRATVVDPRQAPALERDIALRRLECEQLGAWFEQFDGPLIIAGDLNMPADSAIYRDTWSWLDNAFSQAGFGFGYTKITPVIGIEFGLRIDHVLFDEHWDAVRAWTGEDIGSDHVPVIAKLVQVKDQ